MASCLRWVVKSIVDRRVELLDAGGAEVLSGEIQGSVK